MAKKKKDEEVMETPADETVEETVEETTETPEVNEWEEKYNAERDAHLRLAAEYDNFRKRNTKEKELLYTLGKAEAVEKLLPVYDNLERALNQLTADEAYKKGVELTMTELIKIFGTLGVEIYGAPGEAFDPNLHNAVMHVEDETVGESVVVEVLQKGYCRGDRVLRYAMVKVAN